MHSSQPQLPIITSIHPTVFGNPFLAFVPQNGGGRLAVIWKLIWRGMPLQLQVDLVQDVKKLVH